MRSAGLIEKDKVIAIIGEMISGDTMAGGPIAEKAKIPMVSPTATNPLVTQGKKYVFRVCFIDPVQGEIAAKYAFYHPKSQEGGPDRRQIPGLLRGPGQIL